jgi:cysteine desulfurase
VQRIYLDNNATTAIRPEVLDAMAPFLSASSGNASSLHREGRQARRAIESAREQIASLLDAEPSQIVFTSGGTEANNLALLGFAGTTPTRVALSAVEHPSVQSCFDLLGKRGFEVTRIPVNRQGVVQSDAFHTTLERRPLIVSVMVANNETGAIQPVAELSQGARSLHVRFHTDAVQAAGKMQLSFRRLDVDSMSISAHKFHGPAGVGALIVRSKHGCMPMILGGHQESDLRAGTEPTALIVGMATALELASRNIADETNRIHALANHFVARLQALASPVFVNGPDHRLAHTVNLYFPDVDGQTAVVALDLAGVACSTGSACSSGAATVSPTLLAMGLSEQQARCSLRFSLSSLTTHEEIDCAIESIASVVHRLLPFRRTSMLAKGSSLATGAEEGQHSVP